MYVVLRLGGNVTNRIYSPRKQSFLDRLENIKPPLTYTSNFSAEPLIAVEPLIDTHREDKPMSIGDQAMQQLKALAKSDALGVDLPMTVSEFNSTYDIYSGDPVDQMVAQQDLRTEPLPHLNNLLRETVPPVEEDQVNAPSHYMLWPDTEVIDLIRKVLTEDELRGWYKGNSLKYRLRLGAKDNTEQDLAKAEKFEQWLGDLH